MKPGKTKFGSIQVFMAAIAVMLVVVGQALAAPADQPKTGQTTSYATEDDGGLQKGVAWPSPRFTNSDSTTPVNGDVVVDQLTGLMWTRDGGTPTVGSCTGSTKTWQGALDYVACLNTNNYLGYTDWRLPNRKELKSLVNDSQSDPASWLNTQDFSNVQGSNYWSSTSYDTVYAWCVQLFSLSGGSMTAFNKTAASFYVWPVRAGQPGAPAALPRTGQTTSYSTGDDGSLQTGVAWPSPRFTNTDGTQPVNGDVVVDQLTGLMWTKDGNAPGPACSPGVEKTWQGALDYVACLNTNSYLGYTDWRLPNINELESLVHGGQANTASWLNAQGFTNAQADRYWSSTTQASYINGARSVNMLSGGMYKFDKLDSDYVWPVRGSGSLDFTPPTGSISINSGAASTNSTSSTLTLSCTDTSGCSQMKFSNDNTTWSTAEDYATSKAWTLTTGDGTKTVYVKFKDTVGNWSGAYNDTIVLDTAYAPADLPKTGQTTSYATGDDGDLEKGVAWPDPRFTVGAGAEVDCVTDNLTGLMWVKSPDSTTRTWADALTYAEGLSLCGYTDWRLPNRKELRSLVNYGQSNSATWLNTQGFSNVQALSYWSSTTYASDTTYAWFVYVWNGNLGVVVKAGSSYVWPVRSGQ